MYTHAHCVLIIQCHDIVSYIDDLRQLLYYASDHELHIIY